MAPRINVARSNENLSTYLSRRPSQGRVLRGAVHAAMTAMLAAGFLAMEACSKPSSKIYSSDPIVARVVDADTGMPLGGVNVVAGWEALGGLEGGSIKGWVMVMEAQTDSLGAFNFPAWGPKIYLGGGLIRSGSPLLVIFKSGYDVEYLLDRTRPTTQYAPTHMHSPWDGQTIKLKRFDGSLEDYVARLLFLEIQINSLLNNDECNWKVMPQFLLAVAHQSDVFAAARTTRQLPNLSYLSTRYGRECGSLRDFVLEHGK